MAAPALIVVCSIYVGQTVQAFIYGNVRTLNYSSEQLQLFSQKSVAMMNRKLPLTCFWKCFVKFVIFPFPAWNILEKEKPDRRRQVWHRHKRRVWANRASCQYLRGWRWCLYVSCDKRWRQPRHLRRREGWRAATMHAHALPSRCIFYVQNLQDIWGKFLSWLTE